eukprot:8018736-Prorocentrum_lima.AAC.1
MDHRFKTWLAARGIEVGPEPGEAHGRLGWIKRQIETSKGAASRAARRLPEDHLAADILDA